MTSDTAARSALLSRDRSPFPATAFAITSRACPARSRSCPAERIPPPATWRQPPRPAWRASCPPGRNTRSRRLGWVANQSAASSQYPNPWSLTGRISICAPFVAAWPVRPVTHRQPLPRSLRQLGHQMVGLYGYASPHEATPHRCFAPPHVLDLVFLQPHPQIGGMPGHPRPGSVASSRWPSRAWRPAAPVRGSPALPQRSRSPVHDSCTYTAGRSTHACGDTQARNTLSCVLSQRPKVPEYCR